MAYPDNLLSRGERVVLHKHPHWKVLVLPIVWALLIIGGSFALAAVVRDKDYKTVAWIAIAVVAVVLLVWLTIAPILRWRTEHFVITTGHVFFRTGILRRREHQIPLSRIHNIETAVTFWGRLLGFGSLIVESAADQPLEFENVSALTKVQATLNQLINDDRSTFGTPEEPIRPETEAKQAPAGEVHTTKVLPDQDFGDDFPGQAPSQGQGPRSEK